MNVFGILGPVIIGPSNPHTAGVARIEKITLTLLGAPAVKVDIFLHGSLVKTYKSHRTDKALIVGIMGMATDDSRIRMALELARKQGLEVTVTTSDIDGVHPNTAKATLTDALEKTVSPLGSSIGGDDILMKEANGMEVSITRQYTTSVALHRDASGTIAAATEVMTDAGVNICNFRLPRQQKGGEAVMIIEIDGSLGPGLNERIRMLLNIFSSIVLQPI